VEGGGVVVLAGAVEGGDVDVGVEAGWGGRSRTARGVEACRGGRPPERTARRCAAKDGGTTMRRGGRRRRSRAAEAILR